MQIQDACPDVFSRMTGNLGHHASLFIGFTGISKCQCQTTLLLLLLNCDLIQQSCHFNSYGASKR